MRRHVEVNEHAEDPPEGQQRQAEQKVGIKTDCASESSAINTAYLLY